MDPNAQDYPLPPLGRPTWPTRETSFWSTLRNPPTRVRPANYAGRYPVIRTKVSNSTLGNNPSLEEEKENQPRHPSASDNPVSVPGRRRSGAGSDTAAPGSS